MAKSPAHKFGQIIGDVLEAAIEPLLQKFAQKHLLYLDKKGSRPARTGSKISWTDLYGNSHDLDYVMERGGTDTQRGTPVAFIETAWRRYTKHSRNKAQEIQGALLPLLQTHKDVSPFIGAIVAGVFTEGALTQLKSLGFTLVYFPYETILQAFKAVGVDASFDEDTPDAEIKRKLRLLKSLGDKVRSQVQKTLIELNKGQLQHFMDSLKRSVTRQIKSISILPLHGRAVEWLSIDEAIAFIESYNEKPESHPLIKYEVQIVYNNADRIDGFFADKTDAIEFLSTFKQSIPVQKTILEKS